MTLRIRKSDWMPEKMPRKKDEKQALQKKAFFYYKQATRIGDIETAEAIVEKFPDIADMPIPDHKAPQLKYKETKDKPTKTGSKKKGKK